MSDVSDISGILGCLASVASVLIAWHAKNMAIDAKKVVESFKSKLAEKREAKNLTEIYHSAMGIQSELVKYFGGQNQGLDASEVKETADLLGKFNTGLNNAIDSIKKETGIDVDKICQKLQKHIDSFVGKDGRYNVKAAKQIRSIVNEIVPKIKRAVDKNELDAR